MGPLHDTYGHTVSRDLPLGAVYGTCKYTLVFLVPSILNTPTLKTQGNYNLEREASEPDPHVVDLNSELTKCEGHLSTAVGPREHA